MKHGIGVEGVASEIGALGREKFSVQYDELIFGLCQRFDVCLDEAENAVREAERVGVIKNIHGIIHLVVQEHDDYIYECVKRYLKETPKPAYKIYPVE